MRQRSIAFVVALVACLALTSVGSAKTSISESEIPSGTTAGEPFEVGFTLVDHDGMVGDDASFAVIARKAGTTDELTFPASGTGEPLTYRATLTLPDDGSWSLRVVEETLDFQQDLSSLSVAANPALPVTQAELDKALQGATAGMDKQIVALDTQVRGLEATVGDLTTERDSLQQQLSLLQREQADDGSAWLVPLLAALLGAVAGALAVVATLRRRIARPVGATQPAVAR